MKNCEKMKFFTKYEERNCANIYSIYRPHRHSAGHSTDVVNQLQPTSIDCSHTIWYPFISFSHLEWHAKIFPIKLSEIREKNVGFIRSNINKLQTIHTWVWRPNPRNGMGKTIIAAGLNVTNTILAVAKVEHNFISLRILLNR